MLKKFKLDEYLQIIIVVAFILRLIGIHHGFPFVFHPDEPSVIRSALGLRFNPNPEHFDWPHLHFYVNGAIYYIFVVARSWVQNQGLKPVLEGLFPILWRDPLIFYYISRLVSIVMGTLTLIPVYLTGKTLFNRRVGLLSALVLTFVPFHLHTSKFALIDIPTAFWLSIAMYFGALIYKKPDYKNYILSGIFIGFAASTKYNGGLVALLVPVAHVLRIYNSSKVRLSHSEKYISLKGIASISLAGIASIVGFIFGTPYSVLDYETFSITDGPKGAFWQFANVGSIEWKYYPGQLWEVFSSKLLDDFGVTFLLLFVLLVLILLIGAVFVFVYGMRKKKTKRENCMRFMDTFFSGSYSELAYLLIPVLFLFLYITRFEKTRSHYYIVTYPFFAVLVGFFIYRISEFLQKTKGKLLSGTFVALVFLLPVYMTLYKTYEFYKGDTRSKLYVWMENNVVHFDNLMYEDDQLDEVMKKFSKSYVKKGVEKENVTNKRGLVFLSLNNDEDVYDHLNGLSYTSWMESELTRVYYIQPEHMLGPYVFVYWNEAIDEEQL